MKPPFAPILKLVVREGFQELLRARKDGRYHHYELASNGYVGQDNCAYL